MTQIFFLKSRQKSAQGMAIHKDWDTKHMHKNRHTHTPTDTHIQNNHAPRALHMNRQGKSIHILKYSQNYFEISKSIFENPILTTFNG